MTLAGARNLLTNHIQIGQMVRLEVSRVRHFRLTIS